ncbi:GNAT family N-acetyltransferase [Arenibacter latericius]|uniref:GNAT family N-acetyltransferase n=1 Tax=Arenibacter latericius TaxID=86104 RepID=UPI0004136989|nr:GNAT family N-acetyltransferase [Arenibacter latericius]
MRVKKIDLFADLFEKENGIPEIYKGAQFANTLIKCYPQPNSIPEPSVYSIKFVPAYLTFPLTNSTLFHSKIIPQVKGYSANLDGYSEVNSYVKNQFKSNSKTIHRYVKRLESCFNIEYAMYYGEIEKKTYDFIMDSLADMLLKRFRQLNTKNESDSKWEHTRNVAYNLILKKRASLFVIYDDNKPIEISLNFHFYGILFSAISSYDIDYSKFGLGHVEIFKQIEWCLENDHLVFEMGRGDLDYKRRWSNQIYYFEHHILYRKNSFLEACWSLKEAYLGRLKLYLKSKNIHTLYYNLKSKISGKSYINHQSVEYKVEALQTPPSTENLIKLDSNTEEFAFLNKYIYDFLYSTITPISQVEVYKMEKENTFIIIGSKASVKILPSTN